MFSPILYVFPYSERAGESLEACPDTLRVAKEDHQTCPFRVATIASGLRSCKFETNVCQWNHCMPPSHFPLPVNFVNKVVEIGEQWKHN